MPIDFNTNFGCGECGTCGCGHCSDKKVPSKLAFNFAGLIAQMLTPTITIMDLSGLNGDHDFDLIYHNGTYATGYDTDAMGAVSSRGGAAGDCISCYEATFTGLGDIYWGGVSGTANEANWLRNVNLRLRAYVDPDSGVNSPFPSATGDYYMRVTSIVADSGSGFVESSSFDVYVEWDPDTDTWFCTAGGTYSDFYAYGNPYVLLQMVGFLFWSDTDTWTGSGGYDNNVAAGRSGGAAYDGTPVWTVTSDTDRVTTAA